MAHRIHRAFGLGLVAVALASAGVLGCGTEDQGTGGPPEEQPEAQLSEGQISAVASLLNRAELSQAQVALPRIQEEDVRAFAGKLIVEHQRLEDRLEGLLAERRVTQEESELGEDMRRTGEAMTDNIRRAPDANFDVTYLEVQIFMHRRGLAILDRQLIPQAGNPDLRALLEETRAGVEQHLGEATMLRKRLPPDRGP